MSTQTAWRPTLRATMVFWGLVAILFGLGYVSLRSQVSPVWAWRVTVVLLAGFAVLAGYGLTDRWRGILISSDHRMSLSRLQIGLWSLVVLSGVLTAVLTNLRLGGTLDPLDVAVPSALWAVMGISTASVIASPAVMSGKRRQEPDREDVVDWHETQAVLISPETVGDRVVPGRAVRRAGLVVQGADIDDARWRDLLTGEEVTNAATVDIGKLQMFFFTFILVLAYAAALDALFASGEPVAALPGVPEGMNVLLGISHTGYLANKARAHGKAG